MKKLLPLLQGPGDGRSVRAELSQGDTGAARHALAVVNGDEKLIVTQPNGVFREKPLLFDLARDPGERSPNPPELAARILPAYKAARRTQRAIGARAGTGERGDIDAATRDRLRALGYVH